MVGPNWLSYLEIDGGVKFPSPKPPRLAAHKKKGPLIWSRSPNFWLNPANDWREYPFPALKPTQHVPSVVEPWSMWRS